MKKNNWRLSVSDFGHRLVSLLYGEREHSIDLVLKQAGRSVTVTPAKFRLLPRILTKSERRTALFLLLILLISGGLWFGRWYNRHTVIIPTNGGNLTEGLIGVPRTTNPLLAQTQSENDLARLLYRGLFEYNTTGNIVPDLVDTWRVNSTGKQYNFTLKSNIFWQDGTPLTTRDVNFTFKILFDKNLNSPLAPGFKNIKVTIIDDLSFSITLPDAFSPFVHTLTFGIIPEHIWQNIPTTDWLSNLKNTQPIGSNAWQIKEWKRNPQNQITAVNLVPNPYFNPQPYLSQLNFHFFDDQATANDALKQGSIEALSGINLNQINSISGWKYNLYTLTLPQYTALFLNTEIEPTKDKNVRQALELLIDQSAISNSTSSSKATSPRVFAPNELIPASLFTNTYNTDQAKKLLTKSGYTNQTDGWFKKNEALTITLTFIDQGEYKKTAESIKEQWEKAGIKVILQPVTTRDLTSTIIPERDYSTLLTSEIIGLDGDLFAFWHSSQSSSGPNLSNFKNHDADILLESIRNETDNKKRNELQQKFFRLLVNEAPAIFLYQKDFYYAIDKNLQGVTTSIISQPTDRLNDSIHWYRQTKHIFKFAN